jgi:hypothetical protein
VHILEIKKIYGNRAAKYINVTRCIASFKSEKFEFEYEALKKAETFLPKVLAYVIPYLRIV